MSLNTVLKVLELVSRVIRVIAQLICTALTAGLIVYHVLTRNQAFVFRIAITVNLAVWMVITAVVYFVFSCLSTVPYRLLTAKKAEDAYKHLESMRTSAPKITLNVSCYHLTTRLVSRRNANGTTSLHSETQRVTTHSESRLFNYYCWEDISDSLEYGLTGGEELKKPCISMDIRKSWIFTDEPTLNAFKQASDQIKEDNRYRDRYMDYYEDMAIDGFQGSMIVFAKGRRPFGFSIFWWFVATILFLNVPYCFYIDFMCQDAQYTVKKKISILKQFNAENNFQPVSYYHQMPENSQRTDNGSSPYDQQQEQTDVPSQPYQQQVPYQTYQGAPQQQYHQQYQQPVYYPQQQQPQQYGSTISSPLLQYDMTKTH